ncbi:hypothetical protein ACFE04_022312 [Oxalis oulophora]
MELISKFNLKTIIALVTASLNMDGMAIFFSRSDLIVEKQQSYCCLKPVYSKIKVRRLCGLHRFDGNYLCIMLLAIVLDCVMSHAVIEGNDGGPKRLAVVVVDISFLRLATTQVITHYKAMHQNKIMKKEKLKPVGLSDLRLGPILKVCFIGIGVGCFSYITFSSDGPLLTVIFRTSRVEQDVTLKKLKDFHMRRLQILIKAGPDQLEAQMDSDLTTMMEHHQPVKRDDNIYAAFLADSVTSYAYHMIVPRPNDIVEASPRLPGVYVDNCMVRMRSVQPNCVMVDISVKVYQQLMVYLPIVNYRSVPGTKITRLRHFTRAGVVEMIENDDDVELHGGREESEVDRDDGNSQQQQEEEEPLWFMISSLLITSSNNIQESVRAMEMV